MGSVLRQQRFLIRHYASFVRTSQLLPHPGHTGLAYYVIQRNDTTNDSIFIYTGFLVGKIRDFNPRTRSRGQMATHLTTALPI